MCNVSPPGERLIAAKAKRWAPGGISAGGGPYSVRQAQHRQPTSHRRLRWVLGDIHTWASGAQPYGLRPTRSRWRPKARRRRGAENRTPSPRRTRRRNNRRSRCSPCGERPTSRPPGPSFRASRASRLSISRRLSNSLLKKSAITAYKLGSTVEPSVLGWVAPGASAGGVPATAAANVPPRGAWTATAPLGWSAGAGRVAEPLQGLPRDGAAPEPGSVAAAADAPPVAPDALASRRAWAPGRLAATVAASAAASCAEETAPAGEEEGARPSDGSPPREVPRLRALPSDVSRRVNRTVKDVSQSLGEGPRAV
jgi:hypothetical protein